MPSTASKTSKTGKTGKIRKGPSRSEAARAREQRRREQRETGQDAVQAPHVRAENAAEQARRAAETAVKAAEAVRGHAARAAEGHLSVGHSGPQTLVGQTSLTPPWVGLKSPGESPDIEAPEEMPMPHRGIIQKAGAPLGEHLKLQAEALGDAHSLLGELRDRLDPVLRPGDESFEDPPDASDVPASSHALTVMTHNNGIVGLQNRVLELLHRLEL